MLDTEYVARVLEQANSLLLYALPPHRLSFELTPVQIPFLEHLRS